MKLPHFKKRYVAGALAAGLIMGAAGIAAAYFSATGTGTGKVNVGTATPFTVTQNGVPGGKLYPGQSVTTAFTITNTGGGIQHYTVSSGDVVAAMNGTGTIITATTGKAVPGCKAVWFNTSITSGNSNTLNPGASATLGVTVSMTNGTGGSSTQNACQTTLPKLDVAFGGPAGFALFEADGGTASWTNKATADLNLPTGTPSGGAAGIEVLKPGTNLPTTAPTFKTNAYNAGSPRWVIFFTNGGYVFGYPSGSDSTGHSPYNTTTRWQINTSGTPVAGTNHPWSAVTSHFTGKHVTLAFIVMDTDQTPPSTSTITTVTYGGQKF